MKMDLIGMVTRMEVPMPMMEITIIIGPIPLGRMVGIIMETKTIILPVKDIETQTQDTVEDNFQLHKWILNWKMTA